MNTSVAAPERLMYVEGSEGVHLHILDRGTGSPIVMLPGWPFSNEIFSPQIAPLAVHNRVVIPSLRGFGRSDGPRDTFSYDFHADDLKGLLEGLDLDHVVLCGHSMGAAVAIRYMSRHQGSRVSKLVLCDAAAPVWTRRSGFNSGLSLDSVDVLIDGLQKNPQKVFDELLKVFRANSTSLSHDQNVWLHSLAMQTTAHALVESLVEMRNADLRQDLESINIPTAIFHGVQDRFCPFAFAAELERGIKHSRIVRFEKSGHLPFLEEADTFSLELLKFSSEVC